MSCTCRRRESRILPGNSLCQPGAWIMKCLGSLNVSLTGPQFSCLDGGSLFTVGFVRTEVARRGQCLVELPMSWIDGPRKTPAVSCLFSM